MKANPFNFSEENTNLHLVACTNWITGLLNIPIPTPTLDKPMPLSAECNAVSIIQHTPSYTSFYGSLYSLTCNCFREFWPAVPTPFP